jgi:ribosomal protein S12 methylthiotransferase
MATLDKVVPYIDIPLQHVHPETLRRMKRPWDGKRYLSLLEKLRRAMPDVAVRTTFIVGFPGETEEEFAALLQFVEDARMDRVGAFVFSREPGTPAHDLPNQVPFRTRRARYDRLMRCQQAVSLAKNEEWVGRTLRVLVEDVREGWSIGRSHRDAPEIDGLVFVEGVHAPGSFVPAVVTAAEPYDLFAQQTAVEAPKRKRAPRVPQ